MDDHWRNSQKIARFFIFDARLFFVVLACLMYIQLWTLTLTVITILIFWAVEQRGLSFESALRALRCWVLGQERPATIRLLRRRMTDYGAADARAQEESDETAS
ncbi:MAG: IcmT/TraK family protein [Alphaproteobacteria bacterium]